MKYLFLLLVLAACGAPKAETKQEAAAAALGKEAPTNVPTALGAEWLEMWGEDDDGTEESDIPFIFYTDDDLTPLYLGENKKYRAKYAAFFQEQLELYGRNSSGERIVDREKLIDFKVKYSPY